MGKEAAKEYSEYYDQAFAGETVRFEAKQGGRWFFNVVSPLYPESSSGREEIVGYAVDVTQRKQAERRFSLAQQFAEVGTWEYNFADDTLFWNAECERLFGLEEGEFGETYEDFLSRVHPDDRGRVRKETDPKLIKREKSDIEFEHRIIREDGETRWVREMAQTVSGREGKTGRVVGMVMDITKRKRTKEKLERRAELEGLLRELSGRFLSLDWKNIGKVIENALADIGDLLDLDRTYVFMIDREEEVMNNTQEWCAQNIGGQKEKMQNIPLSSVPEWMGKLEELESIEVNDVAGLSDDWESERKILESQDIKSLLVVPISYGEELMGFVGFDSVTEKREWGEEEKDLLQVFGDLTGSALFTLKTEKELQEREKKYRKIFNNANDAMYLHGVKEGMPTEFMEVNEVATEMLGYSRDELLSMSPRDIDADTASDKMSSIMEELADSDKKTFEVQHRKKDGSLVPVEISAHLFEMGGEKVVHAIARDISERKEHQRELERATLETLHALNRTIEAKDEYTGSHIDRVQDFSVALGERLGLSDERLEQLEYASILHDVGKIGIDDSILGKPGPLTEEEWVEMEKHPKIGERIVSQVDRLEKAAKIIGQHQEKYDGSGYPAGLREEEISLEARIIAVVDAWDAMRTDRPYRDALTRGEAKKELEENKGTQFDPEIVDLFLDMIEEERLELG